MISVTKMIHIDAPVEKVFEFMDDPHRLVEVWPSLMEVRNLQAAPGGGYNYEWSYKMAGVKLDGTSEVVAFQRDKHAEAVTKAGAESHWYWDYAEADGGGTDLTVTVEYTLPVPVVGRLAEPVIARQNERELDLMLANAKTRLEVAEKEAAS